MLKGGGVGVVSCSAVSMSVAIPRHSCKMRITANKTKSAVASRHQQDHSPRHPASEHVLCMKAF